MNTLQKMLRPGAVLGFLVAWLLAIFFLGAFAVAFSATVLFLTWGVYTQSWLFALAALGSFVACYALWRICCHNARGADWLRKRM
ncbi:MAG: hypothetical protein GDA55_07090 [Cellvibrionales bacterium]|nr:hypothetical protein [Cellvibrionales bacterium]